MANNPFLDAALAYAARGWPVFPCREKPGRPYINKSGKEVIPPAKSPYTTHGVNDATTDPATIRAWWRRWPGAAVGLSCGDAGLVVVDCDVKAGIDGIAAWDALGMAHAGALHSRTPSGGLHVVFKNNGKRLGNTAGKLAPGIDTRGAGGYIILPPSRIEGEGEYVALDDWQRDPAPLPGALVALLSKPKPRPRPRPTPPPRGTGGGYGGAALAAEVDAVARAAEGTRNSTLNSAAFSLGQLVGGGELDAGTVRADLLAAALTAGLGQTEAEKTIESGMRAGGADPRQRPTPAATATPRATATRPPAMPTPPEDPPLEDPPLAEAAPEEAEAQLDALLAEADGLDAGPERDALLEAAFTLLVGMGRPAQLRYKKRLAAFGITARDYNAMLKDAGHRAQRNGLSNGDRYIIAEGCHCAMRPDGRGGVYPDPLCNFTAQVIEDVAKDDGTGEVKRAFAVTGRLADGQRLPTGTIDAGNFTGLAWVNELWGVRAVIHAGRDKKDRLREAIQLASLEAESRYIYTHTGWREIDGARVYLSNGGAVGGNGAEVELDASLGRYCLPTQPEGIAEAMRASLRFLDIAPLETTAPLWAAAFLAPLAEIIYPDFVTWLYGKTGTLKSTLAALALCHYGEFDDHAQTSWGDTPNSLERACFILKDAPLLIDDFAPQSDATKARQLERNAAQIVRNVGNQSGRGRLRRDLTAATTYKPRGLVISTGEQVPDGESISGRIFTLELRPGDVDLERLTAAQAEAGRYPHALGGYLLWLAGQWDALAANLPAQVRALRDQARVNLDGVHLRLPDALALLYTGLDLGLAFATEAGAITEAEAEALRARGWDALRDGALAQAERVARERPTVIFLDALGTLLAQGRVYLLEKDGHGKAGGGSAGEELLGWYDAEFVYLQPGAAYNRVARYLRDQGDKFPVKKSTLRKYLAEDGLLIAERDGRYTTVIRVGSKTPRALKLDRARFEEAAGDLAGEVE